MDKPVVLTIQNGFTVKNGFKFGVGLICAKALTSGAAAVATAILVKAVKSKREELVDITARNFEKFVYGSEYQQKADDVRAREHRRASHRTN